ncbi:MAG: hypothetical protein JO154_20535 [Chitinophaga sp.]|uniref:hypothetical protein n=1 Tax=Chitinophaga sp. TaxID=1869181 RepID=UPI0025B91BA8|nr:hypothetical protein [Chitinophaga sp.]MBV8255000.1 hypothetical protein [Chitinophaga sp.]
MPVFDSREFEWADVKVVLFGREISGLRGLTFKKSYEKEVIYGAGNTPQAVQRGNKKYDGTLTILKSEFDMLNEAAVVAGFDDIVDVPAHLISITCTYSNDSKIQVNQLLNVEFTDYEDGMKQGEKFKEVALPFICMNIKKS